jgi:hypothetical protein
MRDLIPRWCSTSFERRCRRRNKIVTAQVRGLPQRVSDVYHTDATQVLGWEKFRIADLGNCKYTIQTNSGFYFGLFGDYLTTRSSLISDDEKFELVISSLGSPPILH